MRQTQINGETYVNVNDVADYLSTETGENRQIKPVCLRFLKAFGETLREWGNAPERKRKSEYPDEVADSVPSLTVSPEVRYHGPFIGRQCSRRA